MGDFNPLDELLKAVDRLSVLQVTAIWQDIDGTRTPTKVTQPALIRQLRDSITSSVGAQGGGGTALPNQRNVIDSDAMELYDGIESDILDAYKLHTSAAPYLMPEQNLRQVYLALANNYRAGKLAEDALLDELTTWTGWVRQIEDKLFPPPTIEIVAPCPQEGCGKRWAKGGNGDSIPAIIVEYREPSSDAVNALAKSHAKCRACGTVWRGDRKLRELRYAIDEAEAALDLPTDPDGTVTEPTV
jgi:hypothetical protein